MINAFRTRLINVAAQSPELVGEQYIPADFVPRVLTGVPLRLYRLFYGANYDRTLLNWRTEELLSCIRAAKLEEIAFASDSATLPPPSNALQTLVQRGPVVTNVGDDPNQSLQVLNDAFTLVTSGVMRHRWSMYVTSSTELSVISEIGDASVANAIVTYTAVGDSSGPVTLPDFPLVVRFDTGTGGGWQIDYTAPPQRPIATVIQETLASASSQIYDYLFKDATEEPYRTLRELSTRGENDVVRFAAIVTAHVCKLEGR